MSMKVQVLNANLVAERMPCGDEYHTRSATRSAGASVLRPAVVRQPHIGSHPRSVVRKMQGLTVTLWGTDPPFKGNLSLFDSYKVHS
jgi:hypothetical protein